MIKRRATASVLLAFTLAACGVKSDVEDFMRCAIVAEQLGQTTAANNIHKKLAEFANKNPSVSNIQPFELMQMSAKIKYDELGVHHGGLQTAEIMADVYNSSTCREMHEQDKFDIEKELGLR